MRPWRESVVDAWLLAFPTVTVIFSLPLSVYAQNQGDLGLSFLPVILFLTCLGFFGILTVLARKVEIPPRLIYSLSAFGFFIAINSILTPVRMASLPDEAVQVAAQAVSAEIIGEVLLIVAFIVAVLWLKPIHKRWVAAFAIVLTASTTLPTLATLSWLPAEPVNAETAEKPKKQRPNIYHITWDSYSSEVFKQNLATLGVADEFRDFVFFSNTRSNYVATPLSRASFMTGTFLRQGNIKSWMTNKWREEDITTYARKAGYAISSYTEGGYHQPHNTVLARTHRDYKAKSMLPQAAFLFDVALLRAVPSYFRQDILLEGKGVLSRSDLLSSAIHDASPNRHRMLFNDLLKDEVHRPHHNQYVYAHLMIPHWPHVLDEDCSVKDGVDYYAQSLCATRLMVDLLRLLKATEKYNSSTIVFHSDHGQWKISGDETPKEGYENFPFDLKTRALLTIKPPAGNGLTPLRIETDAAQLLDLPITIAKLNRFKFSKSQRGVSLLPKRRLLERIEIYNGFYKHRAQLEAGKAAPFTHYIYHPIDRSWSTEKPLWLKYF